MKDPRAQKIINKILTDTEKGIDVEAVSKDLTSLREIALEMEDPLIVKTLRLIREKLAEDEGEFDIEIEVPVEEDEEEEEVYEAPDNHFTYLVQLISDSENKYNREEIKLYRTALMEELY